MISLHEARAKTSCSLNYDNYYSIPRGIKQTIDFVREKLPDGYKFLPQTVNQTVNLFKGRDVIMKVTYEMLDEIDRKSLINYILGEIDDRRED